jgi:hypothetical protein
MPRLDAKRALMATAATGLGTVLGLWSTSWPDGPEAAWVSFGGGVAGLAVYLAIEKVVHLRREARRLQDVERQLEAERAHHA